MTGQVKKNRYLEYSAEEMARVLIDSAPILLRGYRSRVDRRHADEVEGLD